MIDKTLGVKIAIQELGAHWPSNRTHNNALKSVRWRFRGPAGQFVGFGEFLKVQFVPEQWAVAFDGRDNEEAKLAYYENALGPLSIEVLP